MLTINKAVYKDLKEMNIIRGTILHWGEGGIELSGGTINKAKLHDQYCKFISAG